MKIKKPAQPGSQDAIIVLGWGKLLINLRGELRFLLQAVLRSCG